VSFMAGSERHPIDRGGDRLRVLVVASTYPGRPDDGTPGFVRDISVALAGTMDVTALVPRVPGAPAREDDEGVSVVRFKYFFERWEQLANGAILENLRANKTLWLQVPTFLVGEAWALRREIRRGSPDVLFINWVVPQGMVALLVGRRVPWVLQTLGGDLYALRDPVMQRVKRMVLTRTRQACAMSQDMCDRMVALGADPSRTRVLPMGADVGRMKRRSAAVVPVPGRIATVGRLVEKKGFHVLLEALKTLPDGWSLEIAGDGPMRSALEQQAAGMPVRFHGQVSRDQVSNVLAEAEVLVFPSVPADNGDQDGLPLALLEAMAAGRGIVVTSLPGLSDAIRDDVDGLVVAPNDPGELAGALERLLLDRDLRGRLGASASERSEEYSIEANGARYAQILEDVVDEWRQTGRKTQK
jgi:colanic acid/amylovoran biosynthesis glycosyltransferase